MQKCSYKRLLPCVLIIMGGGLRPVVAGEVRKIGEIALIQQNTPLMAVSSLTRTDDGLWIIPDYKDGNLKIFDDHGNLLKLLGRRGPGPLEFISPRSCDYLSPLLAIYDFSKQRVSLFRREGRLDFSRLIEFVQPFDFIDLKLMGDEILVSGFLAVSDRSQYCLYSRRIADGRIRYILPNHEKYGFSSFRDYDARKQEKLQLGEAAFCDVDDSLIYFAWEGDLRIIRIDRKTNNRETFGEATKNYHRPVLTRALIAAFNSGKAEDIDAEYQKMSFVNGLFSGKGFFGVLYQNYAPQDALWKMFLQLYSMEGRLLWEAALPGAETYVDLRCDNSFYDRAAGILYYLSITYDQASGLDRYRIIQYKIEP